MDIGQLFENALNRLRSANPKLTVSIECCVRSGADATSKGTLIDFTGEEKTEAGWRVSDFVAVRVTADRDGYLHVFNLGTDGKVRVLFPGVGERRRNAVERGRRYSFPGELYPEKDLGGPGFVETGPSSASSGLRERVLVIISDEDVPLLPQQIHQDFASVAVAKGHGGWGQSDGVVEGVLGLKPGTWSWGLAEVTVLGV